MWVECNHGPVPKTTEWCTKALDRGTQCVIPQGTLPSRYADTRVWKIPGKCPRCRGEQEIKAFGYLVQYWEGQSYDVAKVRRAYAFGTDPEGVIYEDMINGKVSLTTGGIPEAVADQDRIC